MAVIMVGEAVVLLTLDITLQMVLVVMVSLL
jgi:hypothetical protein